MHAWSRTSELAYGGEQAWRGGAQGGGAVREAHRGGGRPRRPPRRPDAAQLRRQRRPGNQREPRRRRRRRVPSIPTRRRRARCVVVLLIASFLGFLCGFVSPPSSSLGACIAATCKAFSFLFLFFIQKENFLLFYNFVTWGKRERDYR